MNRNEIGVNAGKVWQLLSNNEKWSYGLLKRKSGLGVEFGGVRSQVAPETEKIRAER